jgi:hypothetical protein
MSTVHFTSTATGAHPLDRAALELIALCERALHTAASRFAVVRDPGIADYIVFIEPPIQKFEAYGRILAENPIIRQFAERCFAYDWADDAAGFMPGVYPSLRRGQWDPRQFVSGGFLLPYNEVVAVAASNGHRHERRVPELLMSFHGAASHPLRTRLLQTGSVVDDPEIDFSVSPEWFTHSADRKNEYVMRLLSSKFVLCPRGIGPATFRTYEAMALGRAPVIVSEEWMPPDGPDWTKFSLVVSESRICDLPRLVRERERDWAAMGRAAREAWEDHFAFPRGVIRMLEAIERLSLARARGQTLEELRTRWSSHSFKAANGWTKTQRLGRLVSSREARVRIRGRLKAR